MSFKGLNEFQIKQILNLAYQDGGYIDKEDKLLILKEKEQFIKKSGMLEIVNFTETIQDIGGLENLKEWLERKAKIFANLDKAIKFGVDVPKGIIIDIEMMNRYEYMEQKHLKVYDKEPMYIIFDELADIMTTAQRKALPLLQRIGQLGAASKVFLITATQAPNRTVIPANLTLNLGTRVALRCLNRIESHQIINEYGAEKLPKYGKCLVSNWQGIHEMNIPLTPESELASMIEFWENQKPPLD